MLASAIKKGLGLDPTLKVSVPDAAPDTQLFTGTTAIGSAVGRKSIEVLSAVSPKLKLAGANSSAAREFGNTMFRDNYTNMLDRQGVEAEVSTPFNVEVEVDNMVSPYQANLATIINDTSKLFSVNNTYLDKAKSAVGKMGVKELPVINGVQPKTASEFINTAYRYHLLSKRGNIQVPNELMDSDVQKAVSDIYALNTEQAKLYNYHLDQAKAQLVAKGNPLFERIIDESEPYIEQDGIKYGLKKGVEDPFKHISADDLSFNIDINVLKAQRSEAADMLMGVATRRVTANVERNKQLYRDIFDEAEHSDTNVFGQTVEYKAIAPNAVQLEFYNDAINRKDAASFEILKRVAISYQLSKYDSQLAEINRLEQELLDSIKGYYDDPLDDAALSKVHSEYAEAKFEYEQAMQDPAYYEMDYGSWLGEGNNYELAKRYERLEKEYTSLVSDVEGKTQFTQDSLVSHRNAITARRDEAIKTVLRKLNDEYTIGDLTTEVSDIAVRKDAARMVDDLLAFQEGRAVDGYQGTVDSILRGEPEDINKFLDVYSYRDAQQAMMANANVLSKRSAFLKISNGMTDARHITNKVRREYDGMIAKLVEEAKTSTGARKTAVIKKIRQLQSQRESVAGTIESQVDVLFSRGDYAGASSKAEGVIQDLTNVTKVQLARSLLSNLESLGIIVSEVGFTKAVKGMSKEVYNSFTDFTRKLSKMPETERKQNLRALGYGANVFLRKREIDAITSKEAVKEYDPFRTKGLTFIGDRINVYGSMISGMDRFTDFTEKVAYGVQVERLMDVLDRLDNLSVTDKRWLSRSSISIDELKTLVSNSEVYEAVQTKSIEKFSEFLLNSRGSDTQFEIGYRINQHIREQVRISLDMSSQGDMPAFFYTPLGRLLAQFKGFLFAAINNQLVGKIIQRSSIDREGINLLEGILISSAIYNIGSMVRSYADGKEYDPLSTENLTKSLINTSALSLFGATVGTFVEQGGRGVRNTLTPPVLGLLGTVGDVVHSLDEPDKAAKQLNKLNPFRLYTDLIGTAYEVGM